jgi:hypothetical protein
MHAMIDSKMPATWQRLHDFREPEHHSSFTNTLRHPGTKKSATTF